MKFYESVGIGYDDEQYLMDAASKPDLDRLIDYAPCFAIFDHLVIENICLLFECTVFIIIYFETNNLFLFPVIGNVFIHRS